jgi:hypothetical protein
LATKAIQLAIWQLGLPEVLAVPWGPGGIEGAPTHPEFASTKKKAERNSQWHHQTPLLTEKRFQAANKSWTKKEATPGRRNFFHTVDSFKTQAVAVVRLDNAITNCFC